MFALTSVLLMASSLYVPSITGDSDLQLTNRAETSLIVTVEVLGATPGRADRLVLAQGESTVWSARAEGFTAAAIHADGAVDVGERRTVFDSSALTTSGSVRIGKSAGAWTSGVAVVNPDSPGALLSVSLHRGPGVVSTRSVYVSGRASKVLDTEDGEWLSFTSSRPVLVVGYDSNAASGVQVFGAATPLRRRATRKSSPAAVQTVTLTPSKDNTLFESSSGSLSNGAGIHLFAGITGQPARRRALLAFDVASQIPPGSRVTRVSLGMNISLSISEALPMRLHRATTDWGEGASNAGSSRDGVGATARANDATWIHTFSPNARWANAGGDFESSADATASAGSGAFTFASSAALIARVQDWVDHPATNFGWIIIGDENTPRSAKRLDSREIGGSTRPTLTVEFSR